MRVIFLVCIGVCFLICFRDYVFVFLIWFLFLCLRILIKGGKVFEEIIVVDSLGENDVRCFKVIIFV